MPTQIKISLNGNPVELITTYEYWGAVQELFTLFSKEMQVQDARPLAFFLTGTEKEPITEKWMIKKFPKWKDLINRAITRNQVNIVEEYEAHSIYKEVHAFVNDIIDLIIKI